MHIALLRGINVGGKNRLQMKDLAVVLTDVECSDVRTYIQSGNVVFQAPAEVAQKIPILVEQMIFDSLSLQVPVVMRTAAQLRRIVSENPCSKLTRIRRLSTSPFSPIARMPRRPPGSIRTARTPTSSSFTAERSICTLPKAWREASSTTATLTRS
jgi:hypothetical protein